MFRAESASSAQIEVRLCKCVCARLWENCFPGRVVVMCETILEFLDLGNVLEIIKYSSLNFNFCLYFSRYSGDTKKNNILIGINPQKTTHVKY